MSPVGRGLWSAVLVTLLLAHSGSALKCFRCASDTDSRCKDKFDRSQHTLEECRNSYSDLNTYPYCKKEIKSVDQHGRQKDTVRSCAWASLDDPGSICRESTQQYSSQLLHCSICNTDACNGARGSALPSAAAVILPVVAAVVFRTA